jgi:threonine synthase
MFDKLFRKARFKVGRTPLVSCLQLQSLCGLPNLLVKDESRNPFGTFKDRRNAVAIKRALEAHVNKLALVTSGNSGYSLAKLAEGTGLKVVCIVDEKIDQRVKESLTKCAYHVSEIDLQSNIFLPEDVVRLAREDVGETIWDVTNGYENAFESIVEELRKENPEWLITPVGSGEAFVGLYEGLRRRKMRTKLVGVGVHSLCDHQLSLHAGPSIADKLYTQYTPYKARIEAILRDGQYYVQLSDEKIRKAYERVRDLVSCEPSAATAFGALSELNIDKESRVIVVNSGKGFW